MPFSLLPWRSRGSKGPTKAVLNEPDPLAALNAVDGRIPISEAQPRHRVIVGGVAEEVEQSGPTDLPQTSVKLVDDTGALELVWQGRRGIPGVTVGTVLIARGTVSVSKKTPRIIDPAYTILKGDAF